MYRVLPAVLLLLVACGTPSCAAQVGDQLVNVQRAALALHFSVANNRPDPSVQQQRDWLAAWQAPTCFANGRTSLLEGLDAVIDGNTRIAMLEYETAAQELQNLMTSP